MKLKVNHDVIHATDAETIAKLKKTIAGLKGENTKLRIDKDAHIKMRHKNLELFNKVTDLQNQICYGEDKAKINFKLKETELLNIIKKQANYIINQLNK